ncbi:MAG: response regulator [Lachnospiraceae bacterium]|nr:response regulator [Lachnospiraceae bacterium]MDD3616132.1 response regulator [Lachnospiraceae bacterium]
MKKDESLTTQYSVRFKRGWYALLIEMVTTLGIGLIVIWLSLNSLADEAGQYGSEVKTEYTNLITSYVRQFDTAYVEITNKIAEDPSFEEMDAWLKSQDSKWAEAMGGAEIYDGISFTYKGDFARSWSYGDYSEYVPSSRRWYQVAEEADGETATLAPYVTFLDAQTDGDPWLVMSVVKKYNDEIYVDYDIKLIEIEEMLNNLKSRHENSELILFDAEGYVLSCSDSGKFGHNLKEPDDVISASLCNALYRANSSPDKLMLTIVDGVPTFLYLEQFEGGNSICMELPFVDVFVRDLLAITLILIFLIGFEIYLYRHNKKSLIEFQGRDERLTAITHASYLYRLYVHVDDMTFYGEEEAAKYCNGNSYPELFRNFMQRLIEEEEQPAFEEFVSPQAIKKISENLYQLRSEKFTMNWPKSDGTTKVSTIEVSLLPSVIDGRETVGILCRDVSEDAKVLKEALKQAESASQAKGDFMSRMSHEIRTPLNAIIGYLDIAKDEHQDMEKVDHCLDQSKVAARHLLSIINDILDISSIESGRMKIEHAEFDMKQMINSLTTIFYAQAKKKNVQFEVDILNLTEEWVSGDSMRVNQILLNLLSNAVKFTPENGTVRLEIRQIGVHEGKVHMQFCVRDTGIGMSKEYMSRMFTPFEQESAATARNYGGSGLGLSISRNLVKLMGGNITVDSEQGKGTAFTVLLAFGQCEQRNESHLTTDSFSNLRALVVDDEESACEYTHNLLNRCGIKSDTVTSGKKAIRRVKSRMETDHPYDFCILDWNMKEMDGLDTARSIREICGADLPIIIATGYDYSAIIEEAQKAGVNKIIAKPLFQSSLFDMLVNTFGKYVPKKEIEKKQEQIDFKGMHVLLAEDNEMNMEIAVDILTKAGMDITQAVNGKEALDMFTNSEPDTYKAILMDVQMPVMDGYEATRAIRKSSHPQAKSIPIIAMTANAFTSDVTAALAAGMNDHIAKPISYEHLFTALSRLTGDEQN